MNGFKDTRDRLKTAAERLAAGLFELAKRTPVVAEIVEDQYARLLEQLAPLVRPYAGKTKAYTSLPDKAVPRDEILQLLTELAEQENGRWQAGFVSGAVYHGAADHRAFLEKVYALSSQANPLHADVWPSIAKFEAEIVAMTAAMLGAAHPGADASASQREEAICGTVSSGGTESILLAMKAYRDQARQRDGITRPQIITPSTAHVSFDKAAQYFGIEHVRIPVGADMRADVDATREAITRNTIALVGSAPGYPHGVIDPIEELSELARSRGIGFHTDACLGGFVLPWARKLGYPVPAFDFALPGVTSISVDTHKYGYGAKGTSVILYRGRALRRFQYFTTTEWPGGLYFSPTLAGSRAGGSIATSWASLLSMGEEGYLKATRSILETGAAIRQGIEAIDDLEVTGDPLWVIAFQSKTLNVYEVADRMAERGWSLNFLQKPAAVHLCVTLRHTQSGVAERFLDDLRQAASEARRNPGKGNGLAPIYGLAVRLPLRGPVRDLLERYIDLLYEPGAER